jgi:hypothetical protein
MAERFQHAAVVPLNRGLALIPASGPWLGEVTRPGDGLRLGLGDRDDPPVLGVLAVLPVHELGEDPQVSLRAPGQDRSWTMKCDSSTTAASTASCRQLPQARSASSPKHRPHGPALAGDDGGSGVLTGAAAGQRQGGTSSPRDHYPCRSRPGQAPWRPPQSDGDGRVPGTIQPARNTLAPPQRANRASYVCAAQVSRASHRVGQGTPLAPGQRERQARPGRNPACQRPVRSAGGACFGRLGR